MDIVLLIANKFRKRPSGTEGLFLLLYSNILNRDRVIESCLPGVDLCLGKSFFFNADEISVNVIPGYRVALYRFQKNGHGSMIFKIQLDNAVSSASDPSGELPCRKVDLDVRFTRTKNDRRQPSRIP